LKGRAEIYVAKHRAGPLGIAQLAWLSTYTRFESVASDPVVDAALRN
jgi:replicative DNA helicase